MIPFTDRFMMHLKALSGILAKKFGQKIFSEKFKNDRQVLLRGRSCYCVNFLFELLDKSNFATNTHGELLVYNVFWPFCIL